MAGTDFAREAGRRALIAAILTLGPAVAGPGAAQAALTWSGPIAVDKNGGPELSSVSCASTSLCVTTDALGRAIAFDPEAPTAPMTTSIENSEAMSAVSCPSEAQCTAIDGDGRAATFDAG